MTTFRGTLVEQSDGKLVRKQDDQLQPEDRLVFDGPEAFDEVARVQARMEAEIAATGGLEAWKKREPLHA